MDSRAGRCTAASRPVGPGSTPLASATLQRREPTSRGAAGGDPLVSGEWPSAGPALRFPAGGVTRGRLAPEAGVRATPACLSYRHSLRPPGGQKARHHLEPPRQRYPTPAHPLAGNPAASGQSGQAALSALGPSVPEAIPPPQARSFLMQTPATATVATSWNRNTVIAQRNRSPPLPATRAASATATAARPRSTVKNVTQATVS